MIAPDKCRPVVLLCFIVAFILHVPGLKAQTVIGPLDIYVSEQNRQPQTVLQQVAPIAADEGRVVNIQVSDITGPVTVSPTVYNLDGPPCPTYTHTGQRVPATPPPAATANFSANVTVAAAQIPAAGTSVPASFKVKDYGYWTICSSGEKTYFPDIYTVSYNVNSIKLTLSTTKLECCKGATTRINVTAIYPANAGNVSWTKTGDNISISGGDNTGVDVTGSDLGNGTVTATLTAGTATYAVAVDVKVGEVKFVRNLGHDELWYPDGTFDANTMLDPNSIKTNLKWTLVRDENYTSPATIDENTGIVKFNQQKAGKYTIIAQSKEKEDCKDQFNLTIAILSVVVDGKLMVCDGEPAGFKISTIPKIGVSMIQGLNYTFHSAPSAKPSAVPNIPGTTDLAFSALSTPSMTFRTTKALWYEIKGDECEIDVMYDIYATTTINGKEVKTEAAPLSVSADFTSCLYARTFVTEWYVGLPFYHYEVNPAGGYNCTLSQGDFRRKMVITIVNKVNPNSQFYEMAEQEENYHKQQFKGTNSTIINDLYDPATVMAALNGKVFSGATRIAAGTAAQNAFNAAVADERKRSDAEMKKRSCDIEREAKDGIHAIFMGRLKCAYPKCP